MMVEYLNAMHFDDLSACTPEDVCRRTGARYDTDTKCYTIDIWNGKYKIDTRSNTILPVSGSGGNYEEFIKIFIINYLVHAKDATPSGTWVSEKDLQGGEGFFRGPHLLPLQAIVDRFKNDIKAFEKRCETLNGKPVDFADAAFAFQITPKIPVAVLYWLGDEDFPCEARMLFDNTIEQHLALDIVFCLAVEVCATLVKKEIWQPAQAEDT